MVNDFAKREEEQALLVGKLMNRVSKGPDGNYLPRIVLLKRANHLLDTAIKEFEGMELLENNLLSTIILSQINKFARTKEEAANLKWILIKRLMKKGFHELNEEYVRQRAEGQEKSYDGRKTMNEGKLQ